ncbi:MAG TPA: response regulator [Urbifossiella sp.]|jgi:CheY-like chemotaxis protein|nr:response regulator [Urbifossiella sp.]
MVHAHSSDRLRVLVVDDDPDAADSTATLLGLAGFDARTATTGEDALRQAEDVPPDAVFLDLMMPGMDGYEIARRLRERAAVRRPFLVAVSGCVLPEDHRRSADAGLDLHLAKPVEPAVLVGVLKRFARVLARAGSVAVAD